MSSMNYIENEGALFRGYDRSMPVDVWNPGSGWKPYKGAVPKPVEWGEEISEEEAKALMASREAAKKPADGAAPAPAPKKDGVPA